MGCIRVQDLQIKTQVFKAMFRQPAKIFFFYIYSTDFIQMGFQKSGQKNKTKNNNNVNQIFKDVSQPG